MIRRSPRLLPMSVLSTEAINDARLSFGARGLLLFLLSKPDGWKVSIRALSGTAPGAGRDACKSLLSELEGTGYMQRTRTQDQKGRFTWFADVFDSPQIAQTPTAVSPPLPPIPDAPKPCTENPYMVMQPCTENPYMVKASHVGAPDAPARDTRARDNQSRRAGSGAGARISDYCKIANQNAGTRRRALVNPRARTVKVVVINKASLLPLQQTSSLTLGIGNPPTSGEAMDVHSVNQALGEAGEVGLIKPHKDLLSRSAPQAHYRRGGHGGGSASPVPYYARVRNKEGRRARASAKSAEKPHF